MVDIETANLIISWPIEHVALWYFNEIWQQLLTETIKKLVPHFEMRLKHDH